jgi:hypothetical protein
MRTSHKSHKGNNGRTEALIPHSQSFYPLCSFWPISFLSVAVSHGMPMAGPNDAHVEVAV